MFEYSCQCVSVWMLVSVFFTVHVCESVSFLSESVYVYFCENVSVLLLVFVYVLVSFNSYMCVHVCQCFFFQYMCVSLFLFCQRACECFCENVSVLLFVFVCSYLKVMVGDFVEV